MANRQYYWYQNNTQQDKTDTSYVDVATLKFTPDASANYMIYCSFTVWTGSTSYNSYVRLYDDTNSTTKQESIKVFSNSKDIIQQHFMIVLSAGSSPSSQTYKIQVHTDSGGTISIDQINFIALRLESGDVFNSSVTESSTTDVGTLYAKVTVDAGSTGYFCTITSCTIYTSSESTSLIDSLILIDTTGRSPIDRVKTTSTTDRFMAGGHRIDNIANSTYDLGIFYRLYSGAQMSIKDAWVVGLKMDNFNDWTGGESDPGTNITDTTITVYAANTLAKIKPKTPTLVFFSSSISINSPTYGGKTAGLIYDGSTYYYATYLFRHASADDIIPAHGMTLVSQATTGRWSDMMLGFAVETSSISESIRYLKFIALVLTEPLATVDAVQDGTHIDIDWEEQLGGS